MIQRPILIKDIRQTDNHHFAIDWSDGVQSIFKLSELQARCPCARCYDPETSKQRTTNAPIDPAVKAVRIYSAGRYALRIEFTSGCSKGIYSYSFLKDICKGY